MRSPDSGRNALRVSGKSLNLAACAALCFFVRTTAAEMSGSIVAWGWNDYGQCDVPTPNGGFVALAACFDYSLGIRGAADLDFDLNHDERVDAEDLCLFAEGIRTEEFSAADLFRFTLEWGGSL